MCIFRIDIGLRRSQRVDGVKAFLVGTHLSPNRFWEPEASEPVTTRTQIPNGEDEFRENLQKWVFPTAGGVFLGALVLAGEGPEFRQLHVVLTRGLSEGLVRIHSHDASNLVLSSQDLHSIICCKYT